MYYRSKKEGVLRASRLAHYAFPVPKELLYASLDKHHANHVELMERKLGQLFVRGESVVLVAVPPRPAPQAQPNSGSQLG